ncbi:hypothetical protein PILCRDRAFT_263533 [Piloderma croceum F 1598]|uniref:2-(3-amino-3-carboxypropyl)histidine synthase subunit 2 n=1 Tax=Piloderma croceum (strain F 1598) TaxID=765440 RepID=A0A0C3G7V1_PILCF|nr:hypothetical protein PILCRDRAFT_263533 [Piloderma croceum F 1598]
MAAFSASGEDIINRTIDLEIDDASDLPSSSHEFDAFYELERTADEILKGDFRRIALQFPDELLRDSVPIYRSLNSKIGEGRDLYVLADTSYGSCCVDEVAAQHIDADAMVHYGHACMSQTYRLPVIYVFGKKPIDVDHCVKQLVSILDASSANEPKDKKAILLHHDVVYTHRADNIVDKLRIAFEPLKITVFYSRVALRKDPPSTALDLRQNVDRSATSTNESLIEDCTILYIGGESLGLTNLLMTHASCEIYSYDPKSKIARLESSRTNKLLMRRYAVVQKARDADIFGILVGTLGVASYLPLISHIRQLLRQAHKKSYTISVGKLNPAKLANFPEIECFVLVACPENSLIDAKDFFKPIITPYELNVALKTEQSWTGRYVLDFDKLIAGYPVDDTSASGATQPINEEDPDQPIFSTITGKYRQAKRYGIEIPTVLEEDSGLSTVILRNQDSTVSRLSDNAAGQLLQKRSYQGLESRIGQDAPSLLEQGRSGIARGYKDDHR